jgi:site-specific recombinase XerD
MKPTDFAKYLTLFLGEYLPGVRNLSKNTIRSYRDTFKLLLMFCNDECRIKPEKLTIKKFDEKLILDFLNWIQHERDCSISTRNQRLASIHSFFRYVQSHAPEHLLKCQEIMRIPFKQYPKPIVRHLTPEETKILLAAPDAKTKSGRRDITLLSVLYDTGARVQEICNLRVCDVRLDAPAVITLSGKGRKTRIVPILDNTIGLLRSYMAENQFLQLSIPDTPLFFNQRHSKLTRGGVNHILQKYAKETSQQCSGIPETLTAHVMRHTKAMHLYQSGVNLVYIRDILGHVDIATTDIYARADTESKRKALENAYPSITPSDLPEWNRDSNLLEFLNNL